MAGNMRRSSPLLLGLPVAPAASLLVCRDTLVLAISLQPERQDAIGDDHPTLGGETGITSDKYLGLLREQELHNSPAQVHFLDDRKHFFLRSANVDSKFFWFHLDGTWL